MDIISSSIDNFSRFPLPLLFIGRLYSDPMAPKWYSNPVSLLIPLLRKTRLLLLVKPLLSKKRKKFKQDQSLAYAFLFAIIWPFLLLLLYRMMVGNRLELDEKEDVSKVTGMRMMVGARGMGDDGGMCVWQYGSGEETWHLWLLAKRFLQFVACSVCLHPSVLASYNLK